MMEQIILEIRDNKLSAAVVRVMIGSRSFYRIHQHSLISRDLKSSLFIEIEDAWIYLKYQLPQWHSFQLPFCSEQIRPLIKNDFFSELVKDKPAHENWLVTLIGYGIHWI
jgi:hypothetical protein